MIYAHVPVDQRRAVYRRLVARYGQERATEIVSGNDPAANRDIELWRTLGQPKSDRGRA